MEPTKTSKDVSIHAADFPRPPVGPSWTNPIRNLDFPLTKLPAWRSNGGTLRGHPSRSLPFSFEAPVPQAPGEVRRLSFLGVFAFHADRSEEGVGTMGASVQMISEEGHPVHRIELINGRHYRDAADLTPLSLMNGDGTTVETVGAMVIEDSEVRVDMLTIDIPAGVSPKALRFKDLGSPSSFMVFDVFFEMADGHGCPFRSNSGGVPLADLAAIIRIGDRRRFARAIEQMQRAVENNSDLDEARGQALLFIAVVTGALLEMGGSREMHRVQLTAAREIDRLKDSAEVGNRAREIVEEIASSLFREPDSPSAHLVDRALGLIERNYAKNLSDSVVAAQLGLSTSHFRYLFRQATGQPFHKYLIALRLEKAKQMLLAQITPVSQVAEAVGFSGLSHFSRAFSQRFSVSPTNIRRMQD